MPAGKSEKSHLERAKQIRLFIVELGKLLVYIVQPCRFHLSISIYLDRPSQNEFY